ncbi:heparinase II/III domain-containing protein [Paenibacillus lemnae]|uniref:Alginate lyase family protein n=1 Tax=Paenibacillus lemnae TaxID=1330551 RepID=A0A848M425_PAELE|nr:heparinase II/III family protein [Paenibacillus lemnae]NMO94970.1 alginate lyase family protein [Paenibacillus lemnae]
MTSDIQHPAKLRTLIQQAETLLETRGDFFTEGAKLALIDSLQLAKSALEGKGGQPFVRNREFLVPREDEDIQFASKRYTMVPPFAEDRTVFTYYGLEPALEWFEKQDVLRNGAECLPAKAAFVLEKARSLLVETETGNVVGQYDAALAAELERSMEALSRAIEMLEPVTSGDEAARRIVDVYNRLRGFRQSRRLRTDLDPQSSLYLTVEGLEDLKTAVTSQPLVRAQYDRIKKLTEMYTLEDLQRAVSGMLNGPADYEELNRHFYLWSSTDKIVNFKVPSGAVKGTLSFILPAEENQQDGLGHVWIDDLEILTASGASLDIQNGGFDEGEEGPDCWRAEPIQGEPIFMWEKRYPFCGGGSGGPVNPSSEASRSTGNHQNRSLYICNPGPNDEGAWTYTRKFDVQGGTGCTLTFAAKLDGKFRKGLKVLISFFDEQGGSAGEFTYFFNRKSSIPGGRFQLAMQADAIQYAVTGNRSYAEKVKLAMLYTLNDFSQGAEHWLVTNLRPEGSDAYGAVQGGRMMSVMAASYSLIRSADVFSAEEKERLYALVEFMLRYLLDLRDRTEWTPEEAQRGCSNWQTDMCAGTGLMMMAMTDFPNRMTWLNNANAILKAQLELNVNPDASWPESIRYHHASLERFAGYAKVLKNVTGEDWFQTTPLTRMFSYGIDMQTPGYDFFDGKISTPPFGDHALGGGEEFGYFAVFLSDIAQVDKELGDRMYHTWVKAGRPFKRTGPEGVVLENLLSKVDTYQPEQKLELKSEAGYPDAGITVFRKNFGSRDQSYFAIMSSPKPVAHGHLDQGSFILYKNSVPLVMDSGIEGYFDSSTPWHISSYSHACLQFETKREIPEQDAGGSINLSAGTYSRERGWEDVPKSSRVLEVSLGEELESISIEIVNPHGSGTHIRRVTYVREPDLYVICDEIREFEGKVLFSLPVAAAESKIQDSRVYSRGAYSVDLETVFLGPVDSITLEQGRTTPFYERKSGGVCLMDYVRAVADSRNGFLTVLYPKEQGKRELGVTRKPDGSIELQTEEHQVCLNFLTEQSAGNSGVQRPFEVSVSSSVAKK